MDKGTEKALKSLDIDRTKIKTDSRKVVGGDIFVAIKGTRHDGHDFAGEALANGADLVICERGISEVPPALEKKLLAVDDTRKALGLITKRAFGDPSASLEVYGVTGTNGKTTTVFLIDSVLGLAGKPSGIVSTVYTKTRDEDLERSDMTTPDLVKLNTLLSEMISSGKKAAVLEISSHALDQERTCGIELDGAVFTNISPEHLDYHGDMENYLRHKSAIFKSLKPGGAGALNLDDPLVGGLVKKVSCPEMMTFGITSQASVTGSDIDLSIRGSRFRLNAGKAGAVEVRSPLVGRHNVYNMLAASAVLIGRGLDPGTIKKGLENARPVPGRLEPVASSAPFRVFVDYAHTPNAMENVLKCLRSLADGKLICIFGCGGDRDKTKRPVMGKIASDICDRVVVTSDNPRTEDPEDIARQIEKGMLNKNNYSIILKRHDAIRETLASAGDRDTVVIAGKGHEDHQVIGDRVVEFDDKKVAGEILRDMGY